MVIENFPDSRKWVEGMGLVVSEQVTKPWGGYLVIAQESLRKFVETFFDSDKKFLSSPHFLSPKILLVAPHKRPSWQFHDRRGEHWRVILGPVGVMISITDEMPKEQKVMQEGDLISIPPKTRHRLVGLESWGTVAEIWEHSDRENPSNEADNHRLQDDFGRAGTVDV